MLSSRQEDFRLVSKASMIHPTHTHTHNAAGMTRMIMIWVHGVFQCARATGADTKLKEKFLARATNTPNCCPAVSLFSVLLFRRKVLKFAISPQGQYEEFRIAWESVSSIAFWQKLRGIETRTNIFFFSNVTNNRQNVLMFTKKWRRFLLSEGVKARKNSASVSYTCQTIWNSWQGSKSNNRLGTKRKQDDSQIMSRSCVTSSKSIICVHVHTKILKLGVSNPPKK